METEILYCDPALAVCLKPSGVSSETGGMPELLEAALGGPFYCVHRLDKAVGGVMVYARTREAAARLSAAVARREMQKEYLAVTEGVPEEPRAALCDLLYHDAAKNKSYVVSRPRRGVKEAVLGYELLGTAGYGAQTLALLRIALQTGRSHQIRVQFASRGMPLVGDGKYGAALRGCPPALCAASLAFPHPLTGEALRFDAPPPAGFPWELFKLT